MVFIIGAMAALTGAGESAAAPLVGFREAGGSNYVMYRVGTEYREANEPGSWFRPGVLQPVVGTLHQQDRGEVLAQLKAMHDSGQRKIALMLWFIHLQNEPASDGVYGHVVVNNDGALLPQHQQNLRELLELIKSTGYFNELNFRFAPQGYADPGEWDSWDEAVYQENWNLIVNTRALVNEALKGSQVKVIYDLGAEQAGYEHHQLRTYNKRLWQDYLGAYGKQDTYGFSFALSPGLLTKMVQVYDEVGTRPDVYALDVYHEIYRTLKATGEEFAALGIAQPKVIIQETYYNDPQSLEEILRAQRETNMDLLYLMQWPLIRGRKVAHFSVDYPVDFGVYTAKNF